jgi:signal transduction histidine kinase
MLVLTTPEPLPEESIHLLEKFSGVFDLTYTRFNDLLLAEAQTHKANIEVALERVRARALAMQEPEELIEVAEVLRHEMGLLGVEELETSSIYIHDENADTVECWYAITDLRHPEKKLMADQIHIDLQKTWVGLQMFDFYQSDKSQVSILMQGAKRVEWINYCASVSTVLGDFYGDVIPDRTYHLYKFSNGAIGAASAGDISAESWELLSRTASVFSLAYSRFKDLTKARIDLQRLKEEKQRAELALTDLKAAQAQLVQSEKMASLGELTAGIAHEIQNPLNFVNNFSELSNELIEEMQEELEKGNNEEVKNIVSDIRSNLEKINLHGKRADAIVKGMLQHSRTTSGEKQPTDINALADEYLRLAYHGLRAKDKDFNATLKTDFDQAIGKINIIPQDIGRVMLNLINNAFYAVDEKKKQQPENYEPIVSVSTKKSGEKILISVKDNGNGVPQKVMDKIFQPFFTTKPTGQGTGLGLSLSYDIVKVHGGELRVETKEGEGCEFIIQLLG